LNNNIKITIIGAGNLASNLALALYDAGYRIHQVFSQTKKNASLLAKKLSAEATTDLAKIAETSNIYIIAVKDDAIAEVAKHLQLKNQIVVHTSGSISMEVLKNCSKNYGVFYPLQTFSKNKTVDFKTIPICVEASNKTTATTLQYFAKSISGTVEKINSEQRRKIHLAAVFAIAGFAQVRRHRARTFRLAGLALSMTCSPVNGFRPMRALVAGLFTALSFRSPLKLNSPQPFLPRSAAMIWLKVSNTSLT
jgi:predicted short-subunit dehydrogenase-like oxidoreductase (DUF2520 family)